jgi:hypothetical protein
MNGERSLAQPTVWANGKRIPGLKLGHFGQLAVIRSLVRFSHVAAGDSFTTAELQAAAAEALGLPAEQCPLGALCYELWKLHAQGLVEMLPHSRRYTYPTDIGSVSCFSNSSTRCTPPSPLGFFTPSPENEP